MLGQLDLAGKTVLADAAHTNVATAQQILYEQGAEYVLSVKGNQPTLQKTLADLFTQRAFPLDRVRARKSSGRRTTAGGWRSAVWIASK